MKKWLIFGGGVITGFILTILLGLILAPKETNSDNGITMFDAPGDVIDKTSFKVFQVLDGSSALVFGNSEGYLNDVYSGAVYMLTNDDGKYYYDDEIVKVTSEKVVRQIGIYQYETKMESRKTVPIIKIMDK